MKIHHIWDGGSGSLCGQTVSDADKEKHHFEEDETCSNCTECLSIQAGVEK